MAEYHIGCGITAIFAGTLNKNKTMWKSKSPCTDEAIEAVRDYIVQNELGGLNSEKQAAGYMWKLKDGRTLELMVRVCSEEIEEEHPNDR